MESNSNILKRVYLFFFVLVAFSLLIIGAAIVGAAEAKKARVESYVSNVSVQNVAGLRKYVATQDMSDMSQTCHMTFLNVARHLHKSTLRNVATMSFKRHVFEMSS